ncbi:MAG: cob(I)yrinic acid a,c-diamide adenosyltransferase [Candidatus Marinimicrobia bacterium]|nr:cob(I)yrinic acid a,c-diamide adenosyltransferase [Candidatus Neomarinimicrobiota bacterium]
MRLTKIYTRTGDKGNTRLANGEEVSKDSSRVAAYGDVDELNSVIGLVLTEKPHEKLESALSSIQHTLFDLGGELASDGMIEGLVTDQHVLSLEQHIDEMNMELPPLEEFILPGGTKSASMLHLARTVCRRAERSIITLNQSETVAPKIIEYINRLSDLLFVMARFENQRSGNQEVYWKNPRKQV